ncbi:hypothetical protein [Paenibacillus sp. P46E]|uniref:hypothetical protein n=1 Tax=Paenibacillus sp. P46E TaxID=1349436 RepID=UPI000939D90C|nr:hypothetical protein [Paenibacillus sp. P46E]OKP95019.1 hypothetical protein A3849_28240 [Paenibacillus sp. P46E]
MIITKEMIQASYGYAKQVFHKQLDKTTAVNNLFRQFGMHRGSAGDYIGAFCAMMSGDKYTRTINTEATWHYLENINKDYGPDQLKIALKAVKKHTEYYGNLGHGKLRSIEKLLESF